MEYLGDFDRHVGLRQDGLARQTRLWSQAPSAVEHVFFVVFGWIQTRAALAHQHVAGGAGADHVAGMFDGNTVVEQGLANRGARGRVHFSALWAVFGMGQDFDGGHDE